MSAEIGSATVELVERVGARRVSDASAAMDGITSESGEHLPIVYSRFKEATLGGDLLREIQQTSRELLHLRVNEPDGLFDIMDRHIAAIKRVLAIHGHENSCSVDEDVAASSVRTTVQASVASDAADTRAGVVSTPVPAPARDIDGGAS